MSFQIKIIIGISILSFISGMLGLGVAFSAIPFLGLFYNDLVNEVQPISLLLNGITAFTSFIGFLKSKLFDWKKGLILGAFTTFFAPIGAVFANFINQIYLWIIYFIAVLYLAFQLFKPVKETNKSEKFKMALILAIPISILSGLLGVGPGFLLMPTLIICGINPKMAAGINAFAVTPPSFSALIPHLKGAKFDPILALFLILFGGIFSFLGARMTSVYVPDKRIKQIFGILILLVTLYKIITMIK